MDYTLIWNGIHIHVIHTANVSAAYHEIYGYCLSRLEVEAISPARASLPITKTGYLSHYIRTDSIDHYDGPVAYVRLWLDSEAQNPAWLALRDTTAQLSLL